MQQATTTTVKRFLMRSPAATVTRAMRQISSCGNNNSNRSRIVIQTKLLVPKFAPLVVRDPSSLKNHHNATGFSPRWFSSSSSETDSLDPKQIQVRLNEFQDLFVEARMCIDDLNDSVGTTYYDEDAEEAREAVETAVGNFQALLKEITDIEQKNRVLRSNGLKVEQLKGELELTLKGGH